MRRPPSVTSECVLPARTAFRSGSCFPFGPQQVSRSCSISTPSTCWPTLTHRSTRALFPSTSAPRTGSGSGRRRSSETRRLGDERTDWHAWPWWLLPFGWHHLRNTRRRKEPPLSAFQVFNSNSLRDIPSREVGSGYARKLLNRCEDIPKHAEGYRDEYKAGVRILASRSEHPCSSHAVCPETDPPPTRMRSPPRRCVG